METSKTSKKHVMENFIDFIKLQQEEIFFADNTDNPSDFTKKYFRLQLEEKEIVFPLTADIEHIINMINEEIKYAPE